MKGLYLRKFKDRKIFIMYIFVNIHHQVTLFVRMERDRQTETERQRETDREFSVFLS